MSKRTSGFEPEIDEDHAKRLLRLKKKVAELGYSDQKPDRKTKSVKVTPEQLEAMELVELLKFKEEEKK